MLKNAKKIMVFTLIGSMLAGAMLTGCGKSNDASKSVDSKGEVVQLTYNAWGAKDEDAVMKKIISCF